LLFALFVGFQPAAKDEIAEHPLARVRRQAVADDGDDLGVRALRRTNGLVHHPRVSSRQKTAGISVAPKKS
jgi:hypothetical protein